MRIAIINGPNLNLLGSRETDIYGEQDFESYLKELKQLFPHIEIDYFQSNVEGELVDALQKMSSSVNGVLLNAAAYTHSSIAIADAISAIDTKVVEIHISNVLAREEFRKESKIGPKCVGSISGFGLDSYRLGLEFFNASAAK